MPVTTPTIEARDPAVKGRYPPESEDHSAQIAAALRDLRLDLEARGLVWSRFEGVDAEGIYDGTNRELDALHELKALELVHRSLSESPSDRWDAAARHHRAAYEGRLAALTFATYDTDGSGAVEDGETGAAPRSGRLRM